MWLWKCYFLEIYEYDDEKNFVNDNENPREMIMISEDLRG